MPLDAAATSTWCQSTYVGTCRGINPFCTNRFTTACVAGMASFLHAVIGCNDEGREGTACSRISRDATPPPALTHSRSQLSPSFSSKRGTSLGQHVLSRKGYNLQYSSHLLTAGQIQRRVLSTPRRRTSPRRALSSASSRSAP